MDLKSPYFNNAVFLYRFLYQSTANGDPGANGHIARKFVEEGHKSAKETGLSVHWMEENTVKENGGKKELAMITSVQVGDYSVGKNTENIIE